MIRVLSFVAACGVPAVAIGAAPTLSGSVVLSPTCGGPDLEAPGCSQPLAGARLRLSDAAGATVAEVIADAQGRFAFNAGAGRSYRVQVLVAAKLPRCPVVEVAVPAAGAAPPLRIDCDSGRR